MPVLYRTTSTFGVDIPTVLPSVTRCFIRGKYLRGAVRPGPASEPEMKPALNRACPSMRVPLTDHVTLTLEPRRVPSNCPDAFKLQPSSSRTPNLSHDSAIALTCLQILEPLLPRHRYLSLNRTKTHPLSHPSPHGRRFVDRPRPSADVTRTASKRCCSFNICVTMKSITFHDRSRGLLWSRGVK